MFSTNQLFLKPSPLLKDVIDHYWFCDVWSTGIKDLSDHYQVNLPVNCVDWYFSYQNSSHETQIENKKFKPLCSIITGTRSIDKVIKLSEFSTSFRGIRIRFKPLGFYRIFRIPADELYNSIYTSDEVLGNEIKCTQYKLEHVINHYERKEYLDQYFIYRLNKTFNKSLKIERCIEAFRSICFHSGNIRLPYLLKQLDISERTLERDFRTIVGLSPKELCETIRLNIVIRELLTNDLIDWNDLIYKNGYYDQSHLINEFKKATTVTPDWFFKNKKNKILVTNSLLVFNNTEITKDAIKYANENYNSFLKERSSSSLL